MDTEKLIERLRPALKLTEGLETGQDCEEYAFAKAEGFQAMTYIPEAFEALRALPDTIDALEASTRRVKELEVAAGWRDIESAPHDGSYIIAGRFINDALVWVKHSRWITAAEIAELDGWGTEDDFEPAWTDGNDDLEPCYPTHWMPCDRPSVSQEGL